MYPLIRFAKEMLKFRNAPQLGPTDPHISTHICWLWDLDPWIELNNGRTLTLYDLGRIPMATRSGLIEVLKENQWGVTVAGSSTRYRRRIKVFNRFTMVSRMVGWDNRFIYMDQSMWRGGECCNQVLIRSAITSKNGIVPPSKVFAAMGHSSEEPPETPGWIKAWIDAEAARPWPPEIPETAKAHLSA